MKKGANLHWAWIIVAVCFVDLFINYSVRIGYGVVLPEMIANLGFSRTAGGTIYNAYLFTYILLTPFTGIFTDRFGARRVISVCSLVLGIGVLLMGTIQSLAAACFFYAIVGIGATGMWTPVITVVQRWFAPNRRGMALGILSTGYGLGFASMGIAFPWIVHNLNWRYAWYILGGAAVVMTVGNGLLLRNDPRESGVQPWGEKESPAGGGGVWPAGKAAPDERMTLGDVFRTSRFWLVGVSYFAVAYGLYGITTFMVDYAEDQLGLPLETASLLATFHGLFQIAGVLTLLPLSDRLGRKKTIILSNSLITLCLAGILLTGQSATLLFVEISVMAMAHGATFPMYGACAGDYFPKRVMGSVIGAWTPFYGLGAIATHWVTGILRDTTGSYTLSFGINVFMAFLGIVFMALMKAEGGESAWRKD